MIALEPGPRNKALLRLLYSAGFRVSELCGLMWRDLQERDETAQVMVFGKGDKTRPILLTKSTWEALLDIRGEDGDDGAPVFVSRKGSPLSTSQALRIVRKAAV